MKEERGNEALLERHRARVLSVLGLGFVGVGVGVGALTPAMSGCTSGNGARSGSGLLVAPMQSVPTETSSATIDGGADGATVYRPYPGDPSEPRGGDCEKATDCVAELNEVPTWPYAPPYSKCATTGDVGGTFSERESRKARRETSDACCYISYKCESRHPPPHSPTVIRGRKLEGGPAIAKGGLGAMLDAELFSVVAFRALARDLALHGAPADLVTSAFDAADDEAAHVVATTRLMELANASSAIDDRQATMPSVATFAELVRSAFLDGCVGEGSVALQLEAAAADRSSEEACILQSLAEDESRHADLGWRTLTWALGARPNEARSALNEALSDLRRDGAPWDDLFLEEEQARALANAYTNQILVPACEALLT